MSAQERLRNIDVLSYELETDEMITAQLVKTYLSGLPEENALEIMRGVMKGSVIHLAAEEAEDEGQQDTEESRLVEGKQLAALIDTAVASIQMLGGAYVLCKYGRSEGSAGYGHSGGW